MCRYEKVNFITQLKITNESLLLNQYYDDRTVEGIRDVIELGKDKIFLIGDNEGQVVGEGINRNILLDLVEQGKVQRKDFFYVPKNILSIINIKNRATYHKSNLLLVEKYSIKVIRVKQNPPELRCFVGKQDKIKKFVVTAVFNSSYCYDEIKDNQ